MKICNLKSPKKVNVLYSEIMDKLRCLIDYNYISEVDQQVTKEVNSEILFSMFENFKESNERIIESLLAENNVKLY
jgi:hypothetical protein